MTEVVDVVGWTLIHFVWQGLGVAIAVAVLLASCRGRAATARYRVACAGLAVMAVLPAATAVALWSEATILVSRDAPDPWSVGELSAVVASGGGVESPGGVGLSIPVRRPRAATGGRGGLAGRRCASCSPG